MRIRHIDMNFESISGVLGFIDNWYDLSGMLGVQPKTFSYVLMNKKQHPPGSEDSLYRMWRVGDRVGYYSENPLKFIQKRLLLLLRGIYSTIPEEHMDCIWAYMKGLVVTKKLEEFENRKYLVKFDIKKYYDTIGYRHVVETLCHFGCTKRGAKLIARYLTVKRPGGKNNPTTLQQGSCASPMVSNIVGYYYFDKPLLDWFAEQRALYPKLDIRYGRYCDNFGISLDGEIPMEFIRRLRDKAAEIIHSAGFRYHKWSAIPCNHPKSNQFFLGVVVNHRRRIANAVYNAARATLFNTCVLGTSVSVKRYWDENPTAKFDSAASPMLTDVLTVKKEAFFSRMQGKIAYLKHIRSGHYNALRKLLYAAKMLDCIADMAYVVNTETTLQSWKHFVLDGPVFLAVKKYGDSRQSLDDYLSGIIEGVLLCGYREETLKDKLKGTKFAGIIAEETPEAATN